MTADGVRVVPGRDPVWPQSWAGTRDIRYIESCWVAVWDSEDAEGECVEESAPVSQCYSSEAAAERAERAERAELGGDGGSRVGAPAGAGQFRVRVLQEVRTDPVPDKHGWSVPGTDWGVDPGEYWAEANRHGAVQLKVPNGKSLGVKPGEFEYITLPPEGVPLAMTPAQCRAMADELEALRDEVSRLMEVQPVRREILSHYRKIPPAVSLSTPDTAPPAETPAEPSVGTHGVRGLHDAEVRAFLKDACVAKPATYGVGADRLYNAFLAWQRSRPKIAVVMSYDVFMRWLGFINPEGVTVRRYPDTGVLVEGLGLRSETAGGSVTPGDTHDGGHRAETDPLAGMWGYVGPRENVIRDPDGRVVGFVMDEGRPQRELELVDWLTWWVVAGLLCGAIGAGILGVALFDIADALWAVGRAIVGDVGGAS